MVLADLGTKLKNVLNKIGGAEVFDKKLLDTILNELGIAL